MYLFRWLPCIRHAFFCHVYEYLSWNGFRYFIFVLNPYSCSICMVIQSLIYSSQYRYLIWIDLCCLVSYISVRYEILVSVLIIFNQILRFAQSSFVHLNNEPVHGFSLCLYRLYNRVTRGWNMSLNVESLTLWWKRSFNVFCSWSPCGGNVVWKCRSAKCSAFILPLILVLSCVRSHDDSYLYVHDNIRICITWRFYNQRVYAF